MEGSVTLFTLIEYPAATKKRFIVLLPQQDDYAKAMEISLALSRAGKPVGTIDILIAAMCINRSALLLTKDKDFLRICGVMSELRVQVIV